MEPVDNSWMFSSPSTSQLEPAVESPAMEEARVLANVVGADGDELRFENVLFTVEGAYTACGQLFSIPMSAQGVITVRSTEFQLLAVPSLIPLIRLPFSDVQSINVKKDDLFAGRSIHGSLRNGKGRFQIEPSVYLNGTLQAIYQGLQTRLKAARDIAPPLPQLSPSGIHIALVDPDSPNTLTLTELQRRKKDD